MPSGRNGAATPCAAVSLQQKVSIQESQHGEVVVAAGYLVDIQALRMRMPNPATIVGMHDSSNVSWMGSKRSPPANEGVLIRASDAEKRTYSITVKNEDISTKRKKKKPPTAPSSITIASIAV